MEVQELYTRHPDTYQSFVSFFRYPEGLRAALSACSAALRENMRVLDAGCGTGYLTLALVKALTEQGKNYRQIHGFDLTPAMLERFQRKIERNNLENIAVHRANVLALDEELPSGWSEYDLIMSSSMLEYVSRTEVPRAVSHLRQRLTPDGMMLLFITRRNLVTKYLIERPWNANSYSRDELREVLSEAGIEDVRFRRFPVSHFWLNLWGHIIQIPPSTSTA